MRNQWKDINRAFKQYDRDGSGTISEDQLREVLFRNNLVRSSAPPPPLYTTGD